MQNTVKSIKVPHTIQDPEVRSILEAIVNHLNDKQLDDNSSRKDYNVVPTFAGGKGASNGVEFGGQVNFATPKGHPNSQNVRVDTAERKIRFFEDGGYLNGAYIDLAKCGGLAASEILAVGATSYATGEFVDKDFTTEATFPITAGTSRNITVSTSTDRITITKAGLYLVSYTTWGGDAATCLVGVKVLKNGVSQIAGWCPHNGGHASSGTISQAIILPLSVGDYISFNGIVYPAGTVTLNGGGYSRWNVVLIG